MSTPCYKYSSFRKYARLVNKVAKSIGALRFGHYFENAKELYKIVGFYFAL